MAAMPARVQEQLLVDLLSEARLMSDPNVLCTTVGRAQLAREAARKWPNGKVHCSLLDLYRTRLARDETELSDGVAIECEADFPAGPFDLIALPFTSDGEAELVRDQLQQAHARLRESGILIVSSNNERDRWLGEQVDGLFGEVRRVQTESAVAYVATGPRVLKKRKNYNCEFAFRDMGRLFFAHSRPGVFSHRRMDAGARQLMNAMTISPRERILEIGCGSGVVSLAAAARCEQGMVHAVDSNIRAIECTLHGAQHNSLANLYVEHLAQGPYRSGELFSLALANPPYYANQAIAERFLEHAAVALGPEGAIVVVHQQPTWYSENMPRWFSQVEIEASKSYFISRGKRRGG